MTEYMVSFMVLVTGEEPVHMEFVALAKNEVEAFESCADRLQQLFDPEESKMMTTSVSTLDDKQLEGGFVAFYGLDCAYVQAEALSITSTKQLDTVLNL